MSIQHKKLAAGQWKKMSFFEQMANVGSEVKRALKWEEKNQKEYSDLAFERALELLDLTLADKKNVSRFKEIARTREAIVDYFAFDNEYSSSPKNWRDYFYSFNYAARAGY